MAYERLLIPEEHLAEVITIIRSGMSFAKQRGTLTQSVDVSLTQWCDSEEAYLRGER